MRMVSGLPPQLWFAPALAGLVLILFGVLVLIAPWILNYIIAAMFIFFGATLMAVALSARRNVSYRRLDEETP